MSSQPFRGPPTCDLKIFLMFTDHILNELRFLNIEERIQELLTKQNDEYFFSFFALTTISR